MGRLKPGTTYIYEKSDGITYAREFGAPHNERFEIGRDYEAEDYLTQEELWREIRTLAKTNNTLQAELDRVIMLYYLLKEDNNTVMWHPV